MATNNNHTNPVNYDLINRIHAEMDALANEDEATRIERDRERAEKLERARVS